MGPNTSWPARLRAAVKRAYHRNRHLQQQVARYLDDSGGTTLLVLLDVLLSVLSVILYVVMTYKFQDDDPSGLSTGLVRTQLALSVIFGVNWLFSFWLADEVISFLFSWDTLTDAVTITPMLYMYSTDHPLGMWFGGIRILRISRLFRVRHLVQAQLDGALEEAVTEAIVQLSFTLMCLLFVSAALYYELEKCPYDCERIETVIKQWTCPKLPNGRPKCDAEAEDGKTPRHEKIRDLTFLRALYWATVTLTTVGYGDVSPSYAATEVLVIVMLLLVFCLAPYLTGRLIDALKATSSYQRARFRRIMHRAGHVVFTGAITGQTMAGLLDELYHPDKNGSSNANKPLRCVFLSPELPSTKVRRLLAKHPAASMITYLQGSPFRSKDLHRACVQYASVVYVLAPKASSEPLEADQQAIMTSLSIGRYLQDMRLKDSSKGRWRLLKPPKALPQVVIQFVLPEVQLRINEVMHGLQQQGAPHAAAQLLAPGSTTATGGASGSADSNSLPVGHAFWHEFAQRVGVICVSELREALTAHSLLGVPGIITLISNLCTTTDMEEEQETFEPSWLQLYRQGANQEIYQLQQFPAALHGQTYKVAAGFVFDSVHAVLLAVEDRSIWSSGRCSSSLVIAGIDAIITSSMTGYIIADNSRDVELIRSTTPQQFEEWRHQRLGRAALPDGSSSRGYGGGSSSSPNNCHPELQRLWNCACNGSAASRYVVQVGSSRMDLEAAAQLDLRGQQHMRALRPGGSRNSQHSSRQQQSSILEDASHTTPAQQLQCQLGRWLSQGKPDEEVDALVAQCAAALVATMGDNRQRTGTSSVHQCTTFSAIIHLLRSAEEAKHALAVRFMCRHYHVKISDGNAPACTAPAGQQQGSTSTSSGLSSSEFFAGLQGHTLLIGLPNSSSSLLALLAPLRSRHISTCRPVVIVAREEQQDSLTRDDCWHIVQQLQDIYWFTATGGITAALRQVNARQAAQAVIASTAVLGQGKQKEAQQQQQQDNDKQDEDDRRLASKVNQDSQALNLYNLLKNLNPEMQIIAELRLPQNISYVEAMPPARGLSKRQWPLISPAYAAGSVFLGGLVDRLMLASHSNGASDRIVLRLLDSWHTAAPRVTAHSAAEVMPAVLEASCQQRHQADSGQQEQQLVLPQCQDQEERAVAMPQAAASHWSSSTAAGTDYRPMSPSSTSLTSSALKDIEAGQRPDQNHHHSVVWPAAAERQLPAAVAAMQQQATALGGDGPQTILRIRVPQALPAGFHTDQDFTYGAYFHWLLLEHRLLLLGLYRAVLPGDTVDTSTSTNTSSTNTRRRGGAGFRVVITNPPYGEPVLLGSDEAFVVATLPFCRRPAAQQMAAACDGPEAAAAAATAALDATALTWPPETLGFCHSDPAAVVRQQHRQHPEQATDTPRQQLRELLPGSSAPNDQQQQQQLQQQQQQQQQQQSQQQWQQAVPATSIGWDDGASEQDERGEPATAATAAAAATAATDEGVCLNAAYQQNWLDNSDNMCYP